MPTRVCVCRGGVCVCVCPESGGSAAAPRRQQEPDPGAGADANGRRSARRADPTQAGGLQQALGTADGQGKTPAAPPVALKPHLSL